MELTWIGKSKRPRPETRSLRALEEFGKENQADNRLIFGDNLLALKALATQFQNRVRCAFIDPPYNTGSAFEHYDDGLEHSLWLSFMRDRVELIRDLLSPDGSLWIAIDDHEGHYLKVLCDEIFGRRNFVANVVWQKRISPEARLQLGPAHDTILVYAKDKARLRFNPLPLGDKQRKSYRNADGDRRGPWVSTDFTAQGWRPNQMYPITTPAGIVHQPPHGRCWANVEPVFKRLRAEGRIWFGADGDARPRIKNFLSEAKGLRPWTWWPHEEAGHNQEAKKESIALFGDAPFATPKPERLVKRVLEIASDPGDLVLDSFAGSGTTGAVAHKMGRRWIMVEHGAHCHSHILPRMRRVVDGSDAGGVSGELCWQGGGGFQLFELGPSLLEKDAHGRHVVSSRLASAELVEAVCRQFGFTPEPQARDPWRHGSSSERHFIHVAPRMLFREDLLPLSEALEPDATLLVACLAHDTDAGSFPNLDIRKIPRDLPDAIDWAKDDYSLALALT